MLLRNAKRTGASARRGATAVVVAICLVPLIGVMAFAIDGGLLMAQRRQVQAAADASAHAAACTLYTNNSTDNGLDPRGLARAAALAFASANGYSNDGTRSVVTVNIPPTSGTFSGRSSYAEVLVTYNQDKAFSAIWRSGSLAVRARTVARGLTAQAVPYSTASILLLDPSASGSLSVAGSAKVVVESSIQVNSSNASAVTATNAGTISAKSPTPNPAPQINVVGQSTTNSGGAINIRVAGGAPAVSNPMSSVAAPNPTTLTTQSFNSPGYGSATLNPGVYNGGLTFGNGMSITLNPGIYYMKGGNFTVANGVTLNGSGVMIYMDNGGGQFNFQGGGVINMSAPTSGPYAGIVMFQDPNSSKSVSIANGSTTAITGTVYAAGATVSIAGGAQNSQYGSQFIVKNLNLSNNASININTLSSPPPASHTGSASIAIVE